MIGRVLYETAFLASILFVTAAYDGPTHSCQDYVNKTTCVLSKPVYATVNESNPCVFACDGKWSQGFTRRLYVQQRTRMNTSSIFTSMQSDNFIKTFTLPVTLEDNGNIFTSLSEIVCPSEGKIFFSLTTNSPENVDIQFDIRRVEFNLPNGDVSVMASPVSPWAKFYKWKDGVDSVFLSVQSKTPADSKICAILYLQQAKCPLTTKFDEIQGSKGKYQTFLNYGGTTVTRSHFPDGVFLVFLPLPNNDLCLDSKDDHITRRRKTIVIRPIEQSSPKYAWISYAASFTLFSIITGSWLFALRRWSHRHFTALVNNHGPLTLGDPDLREPYAFLRILQVLQMFTQRHQASVPEEFSEGDAECPEANLLRRTESDESLIISSVAREAPIELMEMNRLPFTPMVSFIPVSEELNPSVVSWWRSESTYQELRPSSKLSEVAFSRNILMVAAFSTIPVFSTLKFLLDLSDHRLDTCYFNRKCMISAGRFQDFSKMFSNFGYIVVGLALKHFIGYHERLTLATEKIVGMNDIGVCRQYSLFNVLAYELIMQASMSALFHMCPNYVTIKFDMIFIFAIAITYIGCVWSLRHGDFNEFTYSTFGLISSALFLAECRYFMPHWTFWLIIGTIHMYLVLTISFLLTKFGTFSFNPADMLHLYRKWRSVKEEVKQLNLMQTQNPFVTLAKVAIGVILNAVVLGVASVQDYDFYSYLFVVSVTNVNYYTVHYVLTKRIIMRETGTRHGWASFALAFAFAIPSVVFYSMSSIDYNESPAQSLNANSFCLLTVFSAHDFWHLTSAFTLFALFTGILIIDDDLAVRKSATAPVF